MGEIPTPNERALAASQLFATIDRELVSRLAQASTRTRYERGAFVWHAREDASHLTIIANGLVKIVTSGADGTEAILALFGPRESIGDMAVFGSKRYPADAIAVSDSLDVIRIPAAVIQEATVVHPPLMAALNASLISHSAALQEKIRIMSAGTVPKRLATLLLHLATRFGDELEDGTTFIPISLSRTECAHLVGATVETTIRTFSRWFKEGLVDTTPDGFALKAIAELERLTVE